ncbi:exonuclease domain-containing protein [Streptacidiphilus griseoplanus]|uniref:exonuclease domain-containing protein n=1 Tax=Peterkaempfera griseoplana TaxID=66896 RepID=UPI0012FEC530|nr:exonuclease domain-containing protein [Peterkaempfera griseoplana]
MAALDFEASDKHHQTARIVSCALVLASGGLGTDTRTWLVNPGVPQEPEAIAVHKLTDEHLAAHGQDAGQAVHQIAQAVAEVVAAGVPLVGHNIGGYDLNLLDAECRRHLGAGLEEICGQPLTRVIDTMVLDRHAAPFRSKDQGGYTLRTSATMYGLSWDEEQAHGAAYDALKSAQVAWVMGSLARRPHAERPEWVLGLRTSRFSDLDVSDVEELHRRQIGWAAAGAASYQASLRNPEKAGDRFDPNAVIEGRWPLIPAQAAAVVGEG